MEWVSVKDRLPEVGSHVLVVFDLLEPCFRKNRKAESSGHIGCKRYSEWSPFLNKWDDDDYHRVTHWMPLPKPPKED